MDKKKAIIAAVAVFILLAFVSALNGTMQKAENTPENTIAEKTEETKYITYYKWNEKDLKQYKNTYYVNAGIEDEPIMQNYVLLRVETEDGDLEEGTYEFKTDNTANASFLIFMSTEPIEDFNTTEVHEEQIMPNQPFETKLEKGQYVYILQGYANKGIVEVTKK